MKLTPSKEWYEKHVAQEGDEPITAMDPSLYKEIAEAGGDETLPILEEEMDEDGRVTYSAPPIPPGAEEAYIFAEEAHATQKRKWTWEPYIVHPRAVAHALRDRPLHIIQAALLHDVVEDCGITLDQILKHFGPKVRDLVDWCTDRFDKKSYPNLNRKARKLKECERMLQCPAEVIPIKCADFLDNWKTIEAHDPKFAVTYMAEEAEAIPYYYKAIENALNRGEDVGPAREWMGRVEATVRTYQEARLQEALNK